MTSMTERSPRQTRTRGERTRNALKLAALDLLVRDGFHDLKIADICRLAGVANGTFYIHFPDKAALAIEVTREKLLENEHYIFGGPATDDLYDAIFDANRRMIATFVEAGPLNRVLVQLIDSQPEMRAFWQASLARISKRIARALALHAPESKPHNDMRFFVAQAAQGLVDSVMLQIFAWEDGGLIAYAQTPDLLAEHLSILWFRLVYGQTPPSEKLVHGSTIPTLTLTAPREA